MDDLYEDFDAHGEGRVPFDEVCAGLSILCGGSSNHKVRAAFALYDAEEEGYITRADMVTYLESVFKVVRRTSSAAADALRGASLPDLARDSVRDLFDLPNSRAADRSDRD